MALSFNDQACRHVGRTEGFLNVAHQLTNKNASQIGLPNTTLAGTRFCSQLQVYSFVEAWLAAKLQEVIVVQ